MDMNKWADHLLSLHSHARGLLTALYCAKHAIASDVSTPLTSPTDILSKGGSPDVSYTYNGASLTPVSPSRPALEKIKCLNDPNLGEVWKKMMKKFPELAELTKDSRAQAFRDVHVQVLDELRPYYTLLVAAMDFVEISLVILQDSINLVNFSSDINPDLVNLFLDLLVDHVSVIYMLASLGPERKLIAAGYCKAWLVDFGEPERNFNRLSKFLLTYEKPLPVIQDNCTTLAPKIISLLLEMKPDLDQRLCMTADNFRKMAILSLTPEMSGIKAPEPDEKHLRGLTVMNRQFNILVIGFLVCPSEVGKQPACIELLKQGLSYGYAMPLVRNEMLNIIGEYEHSSKAYKKLANMKGVVSDTLTVTATTAPIFHKERRDYLRHQIKQMLCLCGERRILCSKFPMVASAMGFARDEILWYFYHLDMDAMGKRKGKKDVRLLDVGVVELIWLIKDLAKSLRKNVDVIRDHFASQIAQFYAPNLLQLIDNALGPDLEVENMGILLKEIHRLITMFTTDEMGELIDGGGLEALRLNWLRFQVCAALPSAGGVANISDITWLMTDLCERSRWLDNFDDCIEQHSSLRELCFYQNALHEHLKECMDGFPEWVRYTGALGSLAEEFLSNISPSWPAEAKHLTIHSVLFATEVYSILGQYAGSLAHDIALHMITYTNQTLTQEAVSQKGDRKKKKKQAAEKVVAKPGWESVLSGVDPGARSLERQKQLLRNLLFALSNPITTIVYDSEFHPIEFFLETLAERFQSHLTSSIYKTPDTPSPSGFAGLGGSHPTDEGLSYDVKRPSVFLNEVRGYLSAVRFMDNLVPMSCTLAIREVLLEAVNYTAARDYADAQTDQMVYPASQPIKKPKSKPPPIGTNQPFLVIYMAWYSELIGSRATTGTICYSPNRRAFLSRGHLSLQAETFTDINELSALCELVGPHGARFMDEQFVRMIGGLVNATRDMLLQHQDVLERLKASWTDETRCLEILKKFKNIKDHTSKTITLGFILTFRHLLSEAVQKVLSEKCSHLFACIETAHRHYAPNIAGVRPFRAVDTLANDIGLTTRIDTRITSALGITTGTSDAGLWNLLPYLYTTQLWHVAFDESGAYNAFIDGLENNGHCLAEAWAVLLRGTEGEKEFCKVASTMLMRLVNRMTDKELQTKHLESAFLVLKRFTTLTTLPPDTIETLIPHALFQSIIGQVHRKRDAKRVAMPIAGEDEVAF
ncbi:uncharacterized protein SPPG_00238 [Spizellomyces punctatus DAOM BR117]|uniref:CYRIA/CYRIB Rac1 binding domain-containing protein n=1 Tax=Spizellomyces punctatus (strain DAOM BR117) TaxID=645134 RepID=A0A0L0HUD3_SPIPD|nr:uncharacterized protein SPPG_00238 [Spizellomyces punctatus DAOM BR117]KND04510.1 hypothetical protein SPPG_00238 [Spizellomyces punctatus DAOM BR117]|eukprot:XP_016612549.1 hypothetical protein SPPG_00238 [Spizellomyces punctatus DAOM BR117]